MKKKLSDNMNTLKILVGTMWIITGLVNLIPLVLGNEINKFNWVLLCFNLILAGGLYLMS